MKSLFPKQRTTRVYQAREAQHIEGSGKMQVLDNSQSVPAVAKLGRPSLEQVQAGLEELGSIPSIPAILFPLIRNLEQPVGDINVQKIADLVAHDESIAAQCLRMANSPLFGRWQNIDSIRGAVVALGIARVRDIAMSCCVLKLIPDQCGIDPHTFWEHSLGVAMVSRRLARRVGFKDSDKAYLAGLLHDLGIIANLLILPNEFRETARQAFSQRVPFDQAESEIFGFTHCVSGMMLADHWHLTTEISEAVRRHHDVERASLNRGLTALVNIADLVCRACGLGYGFNESTRPDLLNARAWSVLAETCPPVRTFGAARFASEMDMYANEVRRLVSVLFRFER
jgi:putative nucleotidyltransferase with HDIG domain